MATANTYLEVTNLDFDDIRNNLKTYLSTQDQFKDYNFEGSAMAVLLDVLSYNTHYNAYYLNMLANEMFLDTAQQRDSIVSRAKELGYLPTSSQGAQANVSLSFTGVASGTVQFNIPKHSKFTTEIDDVTYTYVNEKEYTVRKINDQFNIDIDIREGEPLTHRFTVNTANPSRYILPNTGVDAKSITVLVQNSSTDTTTVEFTRASNIAEITDISPVFFVEEVADKKYELVFGRGALGKTLINGNVIIATYVVNNGSTTNGATTFSIDTLNVGVNYTSASISTNTNARGGREIEEISSIKFNAPRIYQTQNRAVVDNDYERILLNENPDLQSIVAFGGEKADPPIYGKVYVAVKPFAEEFATENRKNEIRLSIIDRTPLGIDPLIIDPDYTYIIPKITTYYDKSTTSLGEPAIEKKVRSTIESWATTNLERFGNRLRYSKFVRALDNIPNSSILNNDAILNIQKRFVPNTDIAERVYLKFNNAIQKSSLSSSSFTYGGFLCYLDDDGEGNIDVYRYNNSNQRVNVELNVGTVDYESGIIQINKFKLTAYSGIQMQITALPKNLDIIPIREQVLLMVADEANITVVGEYA